MTAVAACFAEILRGGELPGAPGLAELAARAGALASETEDGAVSKLASAISGADALRGGRGDASADTGEGAMD